MSGSGSDEADSLLDPLSDSDVGSSLLVVGGGTAATEFPRFLSSKMPTEVRLKIYKFIFPCKQQLILDPQNISRPSCWQAQSYGETLALLRTCKKVRNEALPLLYSRNTITIIKPSELASTPDPLESKLSSKAYMEIRSLELGLSRGLEELGCLWCDTIYLNKLEKLKLVFYHGDHMVWMKQAADFAIAMMHETASLTQLKKPKLLELRAEMYESVDVPAYTASTYTTKFTKYMAAARAKSYVFNFLLPKNLKVVTLSASVAPQAAFAFATYRHEGWRFNAPTSKSTDNHIRKTLVWEKEAKEAKDVEDTAI